MEHRGTRTRQAQIRGGLSRVRFLCGHTLCLVIAECIFLSARWCFLLAGTICLKSDYEKDKRELLYYYPRLQSMHFACEQYVCPIQIMVILRAYRSVRWILNNLITV